MQMVSSRSKKLRTLFILIAVVVLFGVELAEPVFAREPIDIVGHWAEGDMQKWIALGWLNGDGEGHYRPNDTITVAEFVTLINRMKQIAAADLSVMDDLSIYPDRWYHAAIAGALSSGYLLTTDPMVQSVEEPILRQEAFVLLARAELLDLELGDPMVLNHVDDGLLIEPWAERYICALLSVGLVSGDGSNLHPLFRITRAETVTLLERVHSGVRVFAYPGTFGPLRGTIDMNNVVVTAQDVSLRNMTVKNDLHVKSNVQSGSLRLQNLRVFGSTILDGGGEEISVIGCDLMDVEVNQPSAALLFDFPSSYTTLTITGEGCDTTVGGSLRLQTLTLSGAGTLHMDGGVTLDQLLLLASVEVTGTGEPSDIFVGVNGVKFDKTPKNMRRADGIYVYIKEEVFDWRTAFGIEEDEEPPRNRYDPPPVIPARQVRLVSTEQVALAVGDAALLVKTVVPDDATDKRVVWSSSDERIAFVSQGGRVTARAEGKVDITVSSVDGRLSDTISVTVRGKP